MVDNKYNYIIAYYWPDSGALNPYTWGSQVHYGDREESCRLLSYVKAKMPAHPWEIFKIQENING